VVKRTNEDSAPHTATANDTFDTGRLDKGDSSNIALPTPGTYDYICTYHSYMKGRIVVSASPRWSLSDVAVKPRVARSAESPGRITMSRAGLRVRLIGESHPAVVLFTDWGPRCATGAPPTIS